MSEPRKHHYISQLYLKDFAWQRKNAYKLFAQDKTGKTFEVNIEDIGAERDFYRLEHAEDKNIWEKFYGEKIEPLMTKVLRNIVSICQCKLLIKGAKVISDNDKACLSVCLMYQWMRSGNTRDYARKILEKEEPRILKETQQHFAEIGQGELAERAKNYKIGEDLFREVAMEISVNNKRITELAQILFNKVWVVCCIEGEAEFITSDNPLMVMDKSSLDVTPFQNGITNNSTVLFFPLTPKLLLAMYSPTTFMGELLICQNRIFYLDPIKDKKFIENQNRKQKEQCYRHVFGYSRKYLEL